MSKIIYHIHTDPKFIFDSDRYKCDFFENRLILIGEDFSDYTGFSKIDIFENADKSFVEIEKLVLDANLIILYGLCDFKKSLLKSFTPKSKIAWRFFGYEYYSSRRDLMLTTYTSDILENRASYKYDLIYRLKLFFKYKKRKYLAKKDFSVIKKIDFILLYCKEEYNYLKKYWDVPKFLKLNLPNKLDVNEINDSTKQGQVIIGNSRNIYNNHLDIIQMIPKNYCNANFIFFLNYGKVGSYSKEVERQAEELINKNIYLKFLNKEDFINIYKTSTTFILNSHRQMGLANIFAAIQYGLKIYLNDKNVIKKWLQTNGLLIYSISQFEDDLISNNLSLTQEEKIVNIHKFNKLSEDYTREMFCEDLYHVLK